MPKQVIMAKVIIVKTKKMIREKIKEIGHGMFLVLVAGIIVMAFIYNLLMENLFLSLFSMGIAVFGCYYLFRYITEEEKPLELMQGEELLLKTLDRGIVLFPRKKGKFLGKEGYRDISLYLTSRRILARSRGEFILDIPLNSIQNFSGEEKLKSNYLRVTFLEKRKERDVLLFVGDTKLWMEKLGGLIEPDEDEFLRNAGEVKELI